MIFQLNYVQRVNMTRFFCNSRNFEESFVGTMMAKKLTIGSSDNMLITLVKSTITGKKCVTDELIGGIRLFSLNTTLVIVT